MMPRPLPRLLQRPHLERRRQVFLACCGWLVERAAVNRLLSIYLTSSEVCKCLPNCSLWDLGRKVQWTERGYLVPEWGVKMAHIYS